MKLKIKAVKNTAHKLHCETEFMHIGNKTREKYIKLLTLVIFELRITG